MQSKMHENEVLIDLLCILCSLSSERYHVLDQQGDKAGSGLLRGNYQLNYYFPSTYSYVRNIGGVWLHDFPYPK